MTLSHTKKGRILLNENSAGSFYHLHSGRFYSRFVVVKNNSNICHNRLCHSNKRIVSRINTNKDLFKSDLSHSCTVCALNKSHKIPFKRQNTYCNIPIMTLHINVWSPAPCVSISGISYYLLIVDEHSRFAWVYPLRLKSEVFENFVIFHRMIENSIERRIKIIQSDCGVKF